MRLNITGSRSIEEVQAEFSKAYPFLKLEFFRLPNHKQMLTRSLKIKDARRSGHDGTLELSDGMKVQELESEIRLTYGLNVQVYRKAGNIWLETTRSDNWTLKQQNDHGRELSGFV